MCDHCGCGEHTVFHRHDEEQRIITLEENILGKNDRLAERNRGIFEASKVLVINLVSSPGAGKTTLLEKTIQALGDEMTIGVIEGDQQTDRDAKRIAATGVPAHQIITGDACHLDAHMVHHALDHFVLRELDLLFIENVGNLICPGAFDLGEDHRVLALSTPEGEDKPLKYPSIFISSDVVLVTKTDLLGVLGETLETYFCSIRKVNPDVECFGVAARTGEGMDAWYGWLKGKIETKREQCKYF